MRQVKIAISLIQLSLVFSLSLFGQKKITASESMKGEKCYVWSFSKRYGEKDDLTNNLTKEFEGGLVKRNLFTVLNRIKFADLVEQWNVEKSVQKITDLPDSTINKFKILNANLVIFGEIYEEKENNLIRITIRFQNFESEIKLEEYQDANLNRMNSIVYREGVIENLLDKIQRKITGKKPFRLFDNAQGMFNRSSYTRGITIEGFYFPAGRSYSSYGAGGARLTFQSMKRWGISIGGGSIDDSDGQDLLWAGYSYLVYNNNKNSFNLISTLSLGHTSSYIFNYNTSGSYRDWVMAMFDLKIKYKIFTFNSGALISQLIKIKETDNLVHNNRKALPFLGAGIHIPF